MNSDSSYASSRGTELALSNTGQFELMRGVLERGVPCRTTVRGISMTPFIRDEDVVVVAPLADREEPRVGDVVAFMLEGPNRMAIHRVVASVAGGWLIRGDGSRASDGVVDRERILGRVTRVERNARSVSLGITRGASCVAVLSRCGWLARWASIRRIGRRAGSLLLKTVQSLPSYRRLSRRLVPRPDIVLANKHDLECVHRRLNPAGAIYDSGLVPSLGEWVAKRNGTVLGFVQLVRNMDPGSAWHGHWLFSLTVWAPYRGFGIGEALVRRVIEAARAGGAPELLLAVFEDNQRAIRLYRKLGFEPTVIEALEPELELEGRQHGRRRIVMRKSLVAESSR